MDAELTLLGRDAPLAALRSALDGALAGRGRLALLSGEAGIGKSTLAAAIAREAERRGAAVTRGRAWEYADAPPYFPVWPCLRALGIEASAALSPPKPTGVPGDQGDEAQAFHIWETVLEALSRACASRPQVWVLEDLHAADLLTLDLLTFLAQPLSAMSLLVVATTRAQDPRLTDRMAQRLTRMARDGLDLRLTPLADLEVAALAEKWAGHALPASTVKELALVTRGNPLFVVECARALDLARGAARLALPPTVRQVVLERVALLSDATRDVLACGAVLGREFSAASVARMRESLPARAIDALLPALRAGLVEETHPGQFVFSHTLVCEAIEDALGASERADLHARAAAALEPLGDGVDVLVERARHALLSMSRGDEAVQLARSAAARLEEQGAFDRAYALHARMDEVRRAGLAKPASPAERLEVARLADAAGRHGDCRRICDEVIAGARAQGDAELFGRAVLRLGAALRPGVVDRGLVGLLEEARALLGRRSPVLACMLLARLAAALQPAADPTVPLAMAREAMSAARALGDERVLVDVLETAGSALVDYAPRDERLAAAGELLERATAIGDRPRILRAHGRRAFDHIEDGDFAAFDRDVESLLAVSAELGHPRHRWRPLLIASMRAVTTGDFAESDRCVVEVAQLATLTDDPGLPLALAAHELFRARIQRRDDDALARARDIRSIMDQVPDADAFAAVFRATVAARSGDVEMTRAELARLGTPTHVFQADPTVRVWLFEAIALGGTEEQRREARASFGDDVDGEAQGGHVTHTYEGPRERCVALLEASLGDHAAAEAHFRRALAKVVARRHRPWVAQISYELASLLAPRGASSEAASLLAEAAAIAEALPMPGLWAAIRWGSALPLGGPRAPLVRSAHEPPPLPSPSARGAFALRANAGEPHAASALGGPRAPLVRSAHEPPPVPSPSARGAFALRANASEAPGEVVIERPRIRLSLEGDVWLVECGPRSVRVRDSRGMRLLARLVERPDEEIHVLALASDEGTSVNESSAGDVLDEKARRQYKARLADLEEAIVEAEAHADAGRLAKLRREKDALEAELLRAVGLGGKARQSGSATERARVNVQRRLKDAIARTAEADTEIGKALERAVRTGTYCCFRP